jgi:hypothetical protein
VEFDAVPALPLRFRRIYFSLASASRSRIRLTIAEEFVRGRDCEGGGGEYCKNVPCRLVVGFEDE